MILTNVCNIYPTLTSCRQYLGASISALFSAEFSAKLETVGQSNLSFHVGEFLFLAHKFLQPILGLFTETLHLKKILFCLYF